MTVPNERRGSASTKYGFQVALVAGSALAFCVAWWSAVVRTPVLAVPPVARPARNAYELYFTAAQSVANGGALASVATWGPRRGRPDPASLVAHNSRALALVRSGLALPYVPPRLPQSHGAGSADFVALGRLLAADAAARQAAGDSWGAFSAKLDQLEFAESLMHGSGVEGLQVGASIRTINIPGWSEPVDNLTAGQLREAATRMDSIVQRRPTFAQILTDEKWVQLVALDELLKSDRLQDQIARAVPSVAIGQGRFGQVQMQASWLTVDKRRVLADYARFMDECIALEAASGAAAPTYPPPPGDPINTQMQADLVGARFQLSAAALDDTRLIVRIALRRYYLDHGSYPEKLAALKPDYLSAAAASGDSSLSCWTYSTRGGQYTLSPAGAAPPNGVRFPLRSPR